MKILILNVNWLGDVLFSTSAIRAVRKKFPDAFIACLVPPRCAGVLKNNPYLNEILTADDDTSLKGYLKFPGVLKELRKRRFDRAILFHRSQTKALLAFLAGIPDRAGFAAPKKRRFLTSAYPEPGQVHRIDYFLSLLEKIGIEPDGRVPDFFPEAGAGKKLDELLRPSGFSEGVPYAVVHAGGNWALKRWPVEHFIKWIRLFTAESGRRVVLCGGGSEEEITEKIASSFRNGEAVSVCGRTNLDMLAVLLKKADFLLSNDSGPVHLAASQGTKILALFGPTSPEITAPVSRGTVKVLRKDVGCEIPCYFRSCNARVCMDWLTPEEVFEATMGLLP